MKESVLDVLIYLFENYMFDDDGYEPDQETLALHYPPSVDSVELAVVQLRGTLFEPGARDLEK